MNKPLTIAAIKAILFGDAPVDAAFLAMCRQDHRTGVQSLVKRYDKHLQLLAQQQAAFQQRLQIERSLWPQYPLIAGIDEVGRGPLAGPVVTAAVILPHDFNLIAVNDSKQLSAAQREALYPQIMAQALAVGIGQADPATIDRENIYHATELAMQQAVQHLAIQPDYLLVDAMTVPGGYQQQKLIKGDARSASIGAASIVAKVTRDHLMYAYAKQYPGYDFEHNVGYGTAKHLAGLAKYGVTPIHRQSFAPVKKYLKHINCQ